MDVVFNALSLLSGHAWQLLFRPCKMMLALQFEAPGQQKKKGGIQQFVGTAKFWVWELSRIKMEGNLTCSCLCEGRLTKLNLILSTLQFIYSFMVYMQRAVAVTVTYLIFLIYLLKILIYLLMKISSALVLFVSGAKLFKCWCKNKCFLLITCSVIHYYEKKTPISNCLSWCYLSFLPVRSLPFY